MKKYDQLVDFVIRGDGYLIVSEAYSAGISRTYLARFVREYGMERVAKGMYITKDTFPDELFITQKFNPNVVFSGETALYLHGFLDREYSNIDVTVPAGTNGSRLRSRGIKVHQEKEDKYKIGISKVETNYGHEVNAYNKERCICDLVKNRGKIEIQNYQTAIKTYMRSNEKNLSKLDRYSKQLGVYDEVRKYIEVLV